MLNAGHFRELVSGRRRGVAASLARGVLRAAEVPYTYAVRRRNVAYDRGRKRAHRMPVPVVSVGNLTLGGTGKTPVVKWLARWFQNRGIRLAIVSRGYGAAAGQLNDEARELQQALPEVPHVQNPDRVAAAKRAIEEFDGELVLLDDGFQHRRLARDLDVVLLDALEPFGHEHVFPRGTLREPVEGLARADVICLSRADLVSTAEREAIRRRAAQLAPGAAWCELIHSPSLLLNARGESQPLASLAGRRVSAFCGIGNPAGFRHTLADTGCQIAAWREFPDHHAYTAADVQQLNAADVDFLVCTHKDLVKLPQAQINGVPLWAVAIDVQITAGSEAVEHALQRVLDNSAS